MNNITINEDGTFVEEYIESSLIKVIHSSIHKGFAFDNDLDSLCLFIEHGFLNEDLLLNELEKYMLSIRDKKLKYSKFMSYSLKPPEIINWRSKGGPLFCGVKSEINLR